MPENHKPMRIKKASKALLIAVLIVFMVTAEINGLRVIQDGLTRINTQQILWLAEEDLRHGDIWTSLPRFSKGVWMILDGGFRLQIAKTLLERTKTLCYRKQFSKALDLCASASEILGGYDNEGAFDYECYLISERINHPEWFISSPSRPWLASGSEEQQDK